MASPANSVPVPAIPIDFPELRNLSVEQLEQLEMNQTALEEFVGNMPIIQNYRKAREETDTKANDQALQNLTAHSKLNTATGDLDSLANRLNEVRERTEISFSERDDLMSKFTPKNILRDLETIAQSTDRETEKILSEFTSLDTAKTAILNQRILHHKAKALADLISSHGSRVVSPRSASRQY